MAEATGSLPGVVQEASVPVPAATFPLGFDLGWLHPVAAERDRRDGGPLVSLLSRGARAPWWVHVPALRVSRRMVSNAEYLEFVLSEDYERPDVWRRAWQRLGFQSELVHLPTWTGRPQLCRAQLGGCQTALDAYLTSLFAELRAMCADPDLPDPEGAGATQDLGDQTVQFDEQENRQVSAVRAFAYGALAAPLAREPGPRAAGFPDQELRHLLQVVDARLAHQADACLGERAAAVDSAAFLERLWRLDSARRGVVRVRDVLLPRGWPAAQELPERARSGLWRKLPVTGVSAFEALAYCAWIELAAAGGWQVRLPTEAEWERLAGWGGRVAMKELLPWGDAGPSYRDMFQRDLGSAVDPGAMTLAAHLTDEQELDRVAAASARVVAGPQGEHAVEMLLGFGWQWTCETFGAPRPGAARAPRKDEGVPPGQPVHRDEPRRDAGTHLVAARGAPPLLAGPGTSVRRFGFHGLRGWPAVGFRWIAREHA